MAAVEHTAAGMDLQKVTDTLSALANLKVTFEVGKLMTESHLPIHC